jgi:hypothetical protein
LRRSPRARDVRAREGARDEVARQDEERGEAEVDVAEDRGRPAVDEHVAPRVGVGEQEQVREEHEQHADAADPVAAEQRADSDVGLAVRYGRRGVAHPRRVASAPYVRVL